MVPFTGDVLINGDRLAGGPISERVENVEPPRGLCDAY